MESPAAWWTIQYQIRYVLKDNYPLAIFPQSRDTDLDSSFRVQVYSTTKYVTAGNMFICISAFFNRTDTLYCVIYFISQQISVFLTIYDIW